MWNLDILFYTGFKSYNDNLGNKTLEGKGKSVNTGSGVLFTWSLTGWNLLNSGVYGVYYPYTLFNLSLRGGYSYLLLYMFIVLIGLTFLLRTILVGDKF